MNEMLGTPADRAGAPRVDCYPAHAAFPKWGGVGVRIVTFEACSGYRGRDGHCWPPTGSPEAIDRPRSGRIEARTGLRMMPTFPRSPLSFRTAGFPRYGRKAGFQMGPSRLPRELKSAPDIRGASASLHPSFVHLVVKRLSRTVSGRWMDLAPHLRGDSRHPVDLAT